MTDVESCLRLLSGGFAERDRVYGESLVRAIGYWTPKQRHAAWKLLRRYRKPLAAKGVDHAAVPEPFDPAGKRRAVLVDADTVGLKHLHGAPPDVRVAFLVNRIPGVVRHPYSGPGRDYWLVGLSPDTIDPLLAALHDADFAPDDAVNRRIVELIESGTEHDPSRAEEADLALPGLGLEPFGYQRAGVAYLLDKRRVLLADSPGLGKTGQFLALALTAGQLPAAVVCPANLRLNWAREVLRWLPGKTVSVFTRQGQRGTARITVGGQRVAVPLNDPTADVRVVNYESLGDCVPILGRNGQPLKRTRAVLWPHVHAALAPCPIVGVDEAHYAKNPLTERGRCLALVVANREAEDDWGRLVFPTGPAGAAAAAEADRGGKPWRVAMTGTPVLNRPVDLVNQLRLLGRLGDLGGEQTFLERYCDPHTETYNGRQVLVADGATRLFELNTKLRRACMVRRTKSKVLKDLPPREFREVVFDLTNREVYDQAEADVVEFLADRAVDDPDFLAEVEALSEADREALTKLRREEVSERVNRAKALVKIETLKQLSAEGKLPAVIEWIEDFLAGGEKLLVFATHQSVVKGIAAHFKCKTVMGGTTATAKDEAVREFQEDPAVRLLVLNTKAGGLGLTLTAATAAAMVEFPWTWADVEQAMDRAYGRVNDLHGLVMYYLLGNDTIDGDITSLIDAKRVIAEAVTDGGIGKTGSIAGELIRKLIARARRRQEAA
jgi:SWI/SNF-related matrix-associated actin-dependent regulator of chromatin subfamily A-like protein 1